MTLVWRPGFQFDADASTYIEAVEAADTQALETGVRYAINDFVIGCKNDGIWDAIKASCILAGARTLSGALVPLVGTAPTNYNFVSGDYNRKTGLKGDGSTKYFDSSYSDSPASQNNRHISAYQSETTIGGFQYYISARTSSPFVTTQLAKTSSNQYVNNMQNANPNNFAGSSLGVTFIGGSRGNSSSEVHRSNGTSTVFTTPSVTPSTLNFFVFAGNTNGSPNAYTNTRLAFYSIGESLDLALLDTRVSNLITAIGAAIP